VKRQTKDSRFQSSVISCKLSARKSWIKKATMKWWR